MSLIALTASPDLIDQVHDRLLAAIVDGTLAPGGRVTQESVATRLGVSRQPVSHALQLLKRRGLLMEHGKRGLIVAPLEAQRIRDLYGEKDSRRGVEGTFMWFMEEVGELSAALRGTYTCRLTLRTFSSTRTSMRYRRALAARASIR